MANDDLKASLTEIAKDAMRKRDFLPDFPESVLRELASIQAPAKPVPGLFRDMREKFWISIDNDDSRDLDQLTYAEAGKIYVAVADVDAVVKKGSEIDNYAAYNTTSVYTPTINFPMLPEKLSTDLTSLSENKERLALVVEMKIKSSGDFENCEIYPALVYNRAKLSYSKVAGFLEKKVPIETKRDSKELHEQLTLQHALAELIAKFRNKQGALIFETIEVELIMEKDRVIGLKEKSHNEAHLLIENFMIAANVGITRFLMQKKLPVIKRVVKSPKRWDRIVQLAKTLGVDLPSEPDAKALRNFLLLQRKNSRENFHDLSLAVIKLIGKGEYVVGMPSEPSPGHFDLALLDYAHTTAPNRRFPDLIMQRLLKGSLYKKELSYSEEELVTLAEHCTEKENDANKVERQLQKSAAAMVLANSIGKFFSAVVTGSNEKGTWVRLFDPPIEGKLVEGAQGLDVGDRVTVKLTYVDTLKGFIDFAKK